MTPDNLVAGSVADRTDSMQGILRRAFQRALTGRATKSGSLPCDAQAS